MATRASPKLWLLLGELHAMEEEYPEALDAFRESARLDPAAGRAFLMMGYSALQMGRKRDAIEALEKAVEYPRQKEDALRLLEQVRLMETP
jgi:tetratricopeptide (TPR) repeat protein